MTDDLSLRRIHPAAVPRALERARTYRLLNEPAQAESICLDILAIEPAQPDALKTLILALADQFSERAGLVRRAQARVAQLTNEYERLYYSGVVLEREARAHLGKGHSAAFAHNLFMEAMSFYEKAEPHRPENNDDPILRRNSCLRTISAEGLEPMHETDEHALE
jgi:hypothetical protein